jgi:ABC transporter, ATP-binding protein
MIQAQNVCKEFDGTGVLRGVTITYLPGQANLIIGKSGSGKTVMLKILAGLLQPDSGTLLFEGQDISTLTHRERIAIQRQTGMLFQGGALFDSMTVEQNVMFPLQLHTHQRDRVARLRAAECLERVDLPKAGHLYPSDLSGGMRKRVAIARAIALEPKYLFCDEPNSGLDPQTSLLIDRLIHGITHEFGITTVVNTHDMNSVLEIGDRVTFLYEGRAEWSGTGQEVLTANNQLLESFVFATPLAQRLRAHM